MGILPILSPYLEMEYSKHTKLEKRIVELKKMEISEADYISALGYFVFNYCTNN